MDLDGKALLDPGRWKATVLPLAKRQVAAKAFGFCGGSAAGASYGSSYRTNPCWWPNGEPQLLAFEGRKHLEVAPPRGTCIPGWWLSSDGGKAGAIGWRLQADGTLAGVELHDPAAWGTTHAYGAGGGCFAGSGERKVKKGERAVERPLFWDAQGRLVELAQPPEERGSGSGTDGAWVVGRSGFTGRHYAVLWKADGSDRIVLADSISECYAVADGEQVGAVASRVHFAAALWRGSRESFVSLMPSGFGAGSASGCARGLQVGWLQEQPDLKSGMGSMARSAIVWAGSADARLDLQALLPAPWNASAAQAIEVDGDRVRVAGEATQYRVEDELTKDERHQSVAQRAVVWEARLS